MLVIILKIVRVCIIVEMEDMLKENIKYNSLIQLRDRVSGAINYRIDRR